MPHTDQLLSAVLCKAHVCGVGQLAILVGDLDAHPMQILFLAKEIDNGHWVELEKALRALQGVNLSLMKTRALVGLRFCSSQCSCCLVLL